MGLLPVILGGVGVGLVLHRAARPPAWWGVTEAGDADRGAALERGVTTVVHMPREDPAEAWSVSLDQADLNAWLTHRLRGWLANRGVAWPEGAGGVRARLEADRLIVGVEIGPGPSARIASLGIGLRIDEAGDLRFRLRSAAVGRQPIPASAVRALLADRLARSPEVDRLLTAVETGEFRLAEPGLRLGDGRVVRLLRLRAEPGRLIATCRTEAP